MVSVPTTSPPVLFRSVLRPHRGLGARRSRLVVALLAGVLGVAGLGFALAGAWPVLGFGGLEVGLLYAALRRQRGTAERVSETLRLTARELTVVRIDRRGRRQCWSLPPPWLRVSVKDGGSGGGVELRSHGRALRVGAFLGTTERHCLAAELTRALAPLSARIMPAAAPRPDAGAAPCTPCRPARA